MKSKQQRLLQTVAALSGEIHSCPGFPEFYERMGKNAQGCAEIWQLCIDAAAIFDRVSADVEDEFDFILAIEFYAQYIVTTPFDDLEKLAQSAINRSS